MVNQPSISENLPICFLTGAGSLQHSAVGLRSFVPADEDPLGGAQRFQLRSQRGRCGCGHEEFQIEAELGIKHGGF